MKTEKDKVLERFMKEFFHFNSLLKAGFFTKEMKNDYPAQAKRICELFGYETVYEYGAEEIRCHITCDPKHREENQPFVTVISSIYE